MPTGTIDKFNKNRKYSIIKPKEWKTERRDVLFLSAEYDFAIGDQVEYIVSYKNGKGYAQNIKKIG